MDFTLLIGMYLMNKEKKMEKEIYVVIGATGEYSDRTEWLVAAYENENAAKEHVLKATEKAKEWEVLRKDTDESWASWDKDWNPWDKVAQYMDYTGTNYYFNSVILNMN